MVGWVKDEDLEEGKKTNRNQVEGTDLGENRLTREEARPKKVLGPVEMTTPSASPCLQVEPLKDAQ